MTGYVSPYSPRKNKIPNENDESPKPQRSPPVLLSKPKPTLEVDGSKIEPFSPVTKPFNIMTETDEASGIEQDFYIEDSQDEEDMPTLGDVQLKILPKAQL